MSEYAPSLTPRSRAAGPIIVPRLSPAEVKAYAAMRRARVSSDGSTDATPESAGYGRSIPEAISRRPRDHDRLAARPTRGAVLGGGDSVPVLRSVIGDELRRLRNQQERTLRDVSAAARVSLGYLSEVERGQKEASSELLNSICQALDVPLSVVLRLVSDEIAHHEAVARRTSTVAVIADRPRPGTVASAA